MMTFKRPITILATIFATFAWLNCAYAEPRFKKVFYLVFENEDFTPVIQNPYFAALARRGVLFRNFRAETHPSQPNYIAMVAGSTLNVKENKNVNLSETHIGDQLESKGMTWKNYAEGFPGNCFLGATKGHYARKHVPFLSFTNVTKNAKRCSNVVNFEQLAIDVAQGTTANFNFIVPDLLSDGHDTNIQTSADWIKKHIEPLLANKDLMKESIFIFTYDEGSYAGPNEIYTSIVGSSIQTNTVNNQSVNHYSLLRMIQEEWGLGSLKRNDETATQIQSVFSTTK